MERGRGDRDGCGTAGAEGSWGVWRRKGGRGVVGLPVAFSLGPGGVKLHAPSEYTAFRELPGKKGGGGAAGWA